MGMYAKLMGRITESSLMEEAINVRYCFMMLLAIADPKGYAIGTDVAIARRINMPVDQFKECVNVLMQPDEDSNSKEFEGRRVIESDCERGYFVVNYTKYRDTRDEEERREYMREYMRKYRETNGVASVNSRKPSKPKQKKEEEAKGKGEVNTHTQAPETSGVPTLDKFVKYCRERHSIPDWFSTQKWQDFNVKNWRSGTTPIDWQHAADHWVTRDYGNAGKPLKPMHPKNGSNGDGMFLSR